MVIRAAEILPVNLTTVVNEILSKVRFIDVMTDG